MLVRHMPSILEINSYYAFVTVINKDKMEIMSV